jgi:hypothetical protein
VKGVSGLVFRRNSFSDCVMGTMRPAYPFRLGLTLAGLLLLLSPLAALSDSNSGNSGEAGNSGGSHFAGLYRSTLDKKGPYMDLSLGDDGTATLTEDPGTGTAVFFGHWVDTGGQVKVTFEAKDGKPAESPMVFEPNHDGLQAVTWNHAEWGSVTPPAMKKGYKVRQKYWFTTVR